MFLKQLKYFIWIMGLMLMAAAAIALFIRLPMGWHTSFTYLMIILFFGFPITLMWFGVKVAPRPFNNFTSMAGIICLGAAIINMFGGDNEWLIITFLAVDTPFLNIVTHPAIEPFAVAGEELTIVGLVIRVALGALYGMVPDGAAFLYRKSRMNIIGFLGIIIAVISLLYIWEPDYSFIGFMGISVLSVILVFLGAKHSPKPMNNFTTWMIMACVWLGVLNMIGLDTQLLGITGFGLDLLFTDIIEHPAIEPYAVADDKLTIIGFIIRVAVGAIYGIILDDLLFLFRKKSKPMLSIR